jgi:hypothetical protein
MGEEKLDEGIIGKGKIKVEEAIEEMIRIREKGEKEVSEAVQKLFEQ